MSDLVIGVPNFAVVAEGVLRGGQPTQPGWDWLKSSAKAQRVVKLNTCAEAGDTYAQSLGMELVYKPINLAEQIVFRPDYDDVVAAVDAMQPGTYVHCENGWDRTGLIVGCYRVWKCGWTKDVAYAEMLEHGFHPELLGLYLFWKWAV